MQGRRDAHVDSKVGVEIQVVEEIEADLGGLRVQILAVGIGAVAWSSCFLTGSTGVWRCTRCQAFDENTKSG